MIAFLQTLWVFTWSCAIAFAWRKTVPFTVGLLFALLGMGIANYFINLLTR